MTPQAAGAPVETGKRSPAVAQAFAVLDVLAERQRGLRLSEIAVAIGLPKSSVHRLLATMGELGVTRKTGDGRFVVGPRMAAYAEPGGELTGLLGMFYTCAGQIRDRQDETVQLAVLSGAQVTFVAHVDTTKPVRLQTRIGRQLPAHASASGKAILAFRDETDLRPVLGTGLPQLTEATIHDEAVFRGELALVAERGYATEVEEMTADLSCFSAPVLDGDGRAVAAVTACVPTNSVPPGRAEILAAEVRWAAGELARHR
ncbi:IclR family transcriptional regulator [Amycolatopsis ultiminotia]|uniref:IclR family transcriptional regulator n=1 Tax=Amycolatopsis ultiminotia TaxID=543629 RepID=A0ABP6YDT8_9PSEU